MNIIDFYLMTQKYLHSRMLASLSDLTPEEWHYTGQGNSNSIAYIVWHCVRTEDIVLHFLQGRPPLWNEGKWHERLGLPAQTQGTGMATEKARQLHIADLGLFMQYADHVWREFEEYLASIKDGGAELSERVVTINPVGTIPAILAIGQVFIIHGFTHYGEIAYIRGELGKQELPF